jgi:hypothetical protein
MRLAILMAIFIVIPVVEIDAAEDDRLGLNFEAGSRTSVGITYRIHNRISIRPSVAFQELKADNVPVYIEPGEDFPVFRTTERVLQAGFGVLYRVASDSRIAIPYLGLDCFLGRQDLPFQTLENNAVVYRNGSLRQTSTRGLIGVQVRVVRRLSLYGEAGIEYVQRERFAFGGKKLDVRYFGSYSSGVGVIIYIF